MQERLDESLKVVSLQEKINRMRLRNKEKKDLKKKIYSVAPKFPTFAGEIEGK